MTAGNTALCTVGRTGNDLHYRGYDILDIAERCEFEEIAQDQDGNGRSLPPGDVLTADEVGRLSGTAGDTVVLVRTGTDLWLGDPAALTAYGQVIDVHPVAKGRSIGYSQRTARKDGWLAAVAG